MKNLVNLFETIIIVCLAVLIVTPEILYSITLRAIDWAGDISSEL